MKPVKSEVGKEGEARRREEGKKRKGELQLEVLAQESKKWIGRGERRKIDRGIDIDRIGVVKSMFAPKEKM